MKFPLDRNAALPTQSLEDNHTETAPHEMRSSYGMMLDQPTRRDLRGAILSIVFGIVLFVITGYPGASPLFTAYLKNHLGISDSAYGLILTLPFITVLIQIPFTLFINRFGQIKTSFIIFAALSKTLYFVLAILPLFSHQMSTASAYTVVVVVIILMSSFNWIADSALNTWFGAMIPSEIKGRYFSTRQMIFTVAMLFYALIMSQLLSLLDGWAFKYTFFFGMAALFGLIDIAFYFQVRPPEKAYLPWYHPGKKQTKTAFSFKAFLAPLNHKQYRAYLLFAIFWNFSLQISGPYYNVYMLNTLHFSLGQMTLMTQIIPAIATILFLRKIGQAFDRYGFRPILLLSCGISTILPLSWMFTTPNSNWFVYPLNMLSGTFNIGIELAIMSLAIFLAPHEARSTYLAMKNVAMSLLGFVPAIMLGGFLSDVLKDFLLQAKWTFFRGQIMNPFHVLLMISFTLRVITLLVFARNLSEPTAMSFRAFVAEANAAGQSYFDEKKRRIFRRFRSF
ncbi:MAG: MFS transporter [Eubacteriales bacterium]|nr:MFS transporter [Eubacteriales bacterium]